MWAPHHPLFVASHLDCPVIQREWSLRPPLLMRTDLLSFPFTFYQTNPEGCLAEITTLGTAVENFGFNCHFCCFLGNWFLFDLLVFVPLVEVRVYDSYFRLWHFPKLLIVYSGLFQVTKACVLKHSVWLLLAGFVPVPRWNKGEPPFIKGGTVCRLSMLTYGICKISFLSEFHWQNYNGLRIFGLKQWSFETFL